MTMAAVVLAQVQPDKARCINTWYFENDDLTARNTELRRFIAENQSYHPSGVILAVIARECGSLK